MMTYRDYYFDFIINGMHPTVVETVDDIDAL